MNDLADSTALTTADLAAASEVPVARPAPVANSRGDTVDDTAQPQSLLFTADAAEAFRARWDAVQISFVDDPGQAVQKADELVAQVMKSLAQTFSSERAKTESQFNEGGTVNTESQRIALRRYRSFFQRLLSLDSLPASAPDPR